MTSPDRAMSSDAMPIILPTSNGGNNASDAMAHSRRRIHGYRYVPGGVEVGRQGTAAEARENVLGTSRSGRLMHSNHRLLQKSAIGKRYAAR